MDKDQDKKRLEGISRMFLEVAGGNFSYRIEQSSGCNDELETAATLTNMMTEELGESMRHHSYMNYDEPCRHVAQMTFVLDDNFRIRSFTPRVSDILLFDKKQMLGMPLADFLMAESRPAWQGFLSGLSRGEMYDHAVELVFRAREFFIVPAVCLVSTLFNTRDGKSIVVTAIEPIRLNEDTGSKLQPNVEQEENPHRGEPNLMLRITLSDEDLEKIEKAREYIAYHLDDPDFSIRELAHVIGTNEFKLKYGFKQLHSTTIFRYLQDERLRRASLLIQHSGLPLKNISEMTGFKATSHFSRAFKDKYGSSPSEFRKRSGKKKRK